MRTGRTEEAAHKKQNRSLRILLLLIFILAAAIAAVIFYSYRSAEESLSVSFTEDAPALEAGEEYAAMDFVAASEGDVVPAADYLDTDTAGDRVLDYTVSKSLYGGLLKPEKTFSLAYSVTDTQPPVQLWSGNGVVLERGTEFDINDVIGYGDNTDPSPELSVDGKVDMKTNGRYPLHVTVTDTSGNSVGWDLTVEVADSVPFYADDSPRTPFADFVSEYKKGGRSFGIDVSTWQGDIDFDAVKAAGCEFVIIRIGYSEDGKVTMDDKFEQNYKNARDAGIPVGIYLYSYDNTEEEVRSSADWIIEKLGGDIPDLPVVFDWEDFGRFQTYDMSFADLNNLYDAFAEELSGSGYGCMLYGNLNSLEKVWKDTDTRPVWLAHYTDKTSYKGPYRMWQASCTGRIDGIDADVDMNIMFE